MLIGKFKGSLVGGIYGEVYVMLIGENFSILGILIGRI